MPLNYGQPSPGPMSLSRGMWMPVIAIANDVNERDKCVISNLTDDGNLDTVSPAAETIHDHGKRSEFEKRRDALTERKF